MTSNLAGMSQPNAFAMPSEVREHPSHVPKPKGITNQKWMKGQVKHEWA